MQLISLNSPFFNTKIYKLILVLGANKVNDLIWKICKLSLYKLNNKNENENENPSLILLGKDNSEIQKSFKTIHFKGFFLLIKYNMVTKNVYFCKLHYFPQIHESKYVLSIKT